MTQQHPITPPPELVQQWAQLPDDWNAVAFHIAQWGADQELEACLSWLTDRERFPVGHEAIEDLKAARRPKPPSLKERALAALERYESEVWCEEMTIDSSIIRRALEQLDD